MGQSVFLANNLAQKIGEPGMVSRCLKKVVLKIQVR